MSNGSPLPRKKMVFCFEGGQIDYKNDCMIRAAVLRIIIFMSSCSTFWLD